jgi:hypothetical protein
VTVSYVHRTPRFDSALQDLRSQGGRALLIAEKVEQMIISLLRGRDISEVGKQTRNGEYRIDQCFKFHLGSGYRVVCLIHRECLIFLYAGTHDDCCRWIERNRGLQYHGRDMCRAIPIVKTDGREQTMPPDVEEERRFAEEYEKAIMNKIDDDMLRRIFGGLTQSDCS